MRSIVVSVLLYAIAANAQFIRTCEENECQDITIDCPSDEDCEIRCTDRNSCNRATINGPPAPHRLSILCGQEDEGLASCQAIEANDVTSITCLGMTTCLEASFYCRGDIPEDESCVIECLGRDVCLRATVGCPTGDGAACDISCDGQNSCLELAVAAESDATRVTCTNQQADAPRCDGCDSGCDLVDAYDNGCAPPEFQCNVAGYAPCVDAPEDCGGNAPTTMATVAPTTTTTIATTTTVATTAATTPPATTTQLVTTTTTMPATTMATTQPTTIPATPVPTVPVDPVTIDRVAISPNGAQLHVVFNQDTNMAGAFVWQIVDCALYFDATTLSRLGRTPQCHWREPRVFVVVFGPEATLLPAAFSAELSSVVFLGGLPRIESALDPNTVFVPANPYAAELPGELDPPFASLRAPPIIAVCSEFTLDARGSSGFGGRAGRYEFESVNCSQIDDPDVVVSLDPPQITLDVNTIEPGQACEFSLQVANYLGARSETVRRTVQRSTIEESVDVEIIGPQSGTWSTYKELVLAVDASFVTCGDLAGADRTERMAYAWSVRRLVDGGGGGAVIVSLPAGVDVDLQHLVIPPFVLELNEEYVVSCVVTAPDLGGGNGLSVFAEYAVEIVRTDIVAVIAGPTAFEWPRSTDLELDAGVASEDLDYPDDELLFEWACTVGRGASGCPGFGSLDATSPILLIPAGYAPAGSQPYSFTVTVTSSVDRLEATSTPTVVSFMVEDVPTLTITGAVEVNIQDTLRLEGSVVGAPQDDFDYLWSELSQNILAEARNEVTIGVNQRNLVITEGVLEAAETYVFLLTTTSRSTGLTATATFPVRVFSGPVITTFGVSRSSKLDAPVFLYAFEAVANAAGYQNTEPFRYRFHYDPLDDAGGESVLASSYGFSSFVEVPVLPGQYSAQVEVENRFRQVSRGTSSFVVPPFTSCRLPEFRDLLEGALGRGDIPKVLQAVGELGRALLIGGDILGPNCVAAELEALPGQLFGVIDQIRADDLLRLNHAKLLSEAIRILVSTPSNLNDATVQTSIAVVEFLLNSAEQLVVADFEEAEAITESSGVTLSLLLESEALDPSDFDVFCDEIFAIELQLERYLALLLGPLLSGEAVSLAEGGNLAGGVTKSDVTNEGVSLTGGSEALPFSARVDFAASEAVGGNAGTRVVSLTSVTFSGESVAMCYEDENARIPQGPITIIETDELIDTVDFSLLFTGLEDGVACINGMADTLECGFINETTLQWDTNGCQTIEQQDFGGGRGQLLCRCNHLTTFAVIRNLRENPAVCGAVLHDAVTFIFITLYAMMFAFLVTQIRRARSIHAQKSDNERLQVAYHAVVILSVLCATQVLWLVLAFVGAPAVAVAIFASAARVLMYWASSIMLYVWLSIVMRQLTNVSSARNTRRIIILSVVAATSVLVLLAIGFAVAPLGSPQYAAVEQIGNFLLFAFGALSLTGFAVSGSLLVRKVDSSATAAKRTNDKPTQRIKRFTITFCVLYAVHTLVVLIAAVASDFYARSLNVWVSIYLLADISGVTTVIVICRSIISAHMSDSCPWEPSGGNNGVRYTKRLASHSGASVRRSSNATPPMNGYKRDSFFRGDSAYASSAMSRSSDSPATPNSQSEHSASYNMSVFTQTTQGAQGPPYARQASDTQLASLHTDHSRTQRPLDTIPDHRGMTPRSSSRSSPFESTASTPPPRPQPFPWESSRVGTRTSASSAAHSHTSGGGGVSHSHSSAGAGRSHSPTGGAGAGMSYSESSRVLDTRGRTFTPVSTREASTPFDGYGFAGGGGGGSSRSPRSPSRSSYASRPQPQSMSRQQLMSQSRHSSYRQSSPSSVAYSR